MKKRIFLLFLSAIMLCMTNVPLYAAAVIPDGIIIEENLGGEDELMPMGASGCFNRDYEDKTINDMKALFGWT